MSATTTPSRARPALVIPGLDNRSLLDGKTSMMSCGGLPTPPQSALESRRPSLQFSTMSEYPPCGPTLGAYSQPATPVRGASRHGEHSQSWAEHITTTAHTPSHLSNSFPAHQLAQPSLHPAFQPQQAFQPSELSDIEVYAGSVSQHNAASFVNASGESSHSLWSSPQHVQQTMASEAPASFGPPLFAMSHALGEHNTHHPLGIQVSPQYHAQTFDAHGSAFQTYGAVPSNVYSQPQVVAPSQLSPLDDLSQSQYHAFSSSHHGAESYSTSFSSYTGSLGDFELMRAPSPDRDYFEQSGDEGWLPVKFERTESPSYGASVRRSAGTSSRKRGSRRPRNNANSFHYRHFTGETEVVCDFDPKEPIKSRAKPKSYSCTHVKDNGKECGAKFERQEHLKRHTGSHTNERKFPCPLPHCKAQREGGIQRPDNAADHFKTHLRPSKKGKRNAHYDWPTVRHMILHEYEDRKRANKLLDNLQKWIDAGMPESASQRRGLSD